MHILSHHVKNKLSEHCKEFFKENFDIKLIFTLFKIKNYFSYKDPILDDLKSFLFPSIQTYIVLAAVLAILAKLAIILKLGMREISERITR